MISQQFPSFEALARAFYEVDPLNTCCVPNGCQDEYFPETRAALADMQDGVNLHEAISASLVLYFEINAERANQHAVAIAERLCANPTQSY